MVLDATHSEAPTYLLGLWGLPYPILEAVAFHHDPAPAAQTEFDLLAAVAVAQRLVADSEPRRSGLRDSGPHLESMGIISPRSARPSIGPRRCAASMSCPRTRTVQVAEKTLPRLLCVDDEPRVVQGLAVYLRREYEVLTAHGGEEALERLKSAGPVAVIVSECACPAWTGRRCCEVLKLYPKTPHAAHRRAGRDAASPRSTRRRSSAS